MNDRTKELFAKDRKFSEKAKSKAHKAQDESKRNDEKLEHSSSSSLSVMEKKKKTTESMISMDKFLLEIDSINKDINIMKNTTEEIARINEEAIQAITTSKENLCAEQLQEVLDHANIRAHNAKSLLMILKEDNSKVKVYGLTHNDGDVRTRENLCNSLTTKFIHEMKEYQNAQLKYKTTMKDKITRQVRYINPNVTEEEINRVICSEGGRDELYAKQVLYNNTTSDQITTTYAKVDGKHNDIIMIENSLEELQQIFLDLALLTEQQGEQLDQVEFHVKQAVQHTDDGNREVHESIKIKRKIRKKNCWIDGIVVVCAVIIIIIIG